MRILLAEDDLSLACAVATILQKHGYSVDVVHDGTDALQYLESDLYDAAVLDIMMPKMDGIQVVKTLRNCNNRVPVLLLTAKHQVEDKVQGLDSGADDYLTKPFDYRELLARLRCITRSSGAENSSLLQIKNLTLDLTTGTLATSKGQYQLTNKEFQMMQMLLRNPGQILSAERFLEKIWDADSAAESNTVWTYVSYLRRKLEALDAAVRITTKRNLGYMLEELP